MQDLNVSIIQADLFWEDIPKNIEAFTRKIDGIDEETDLIILPEMFNTGFSINPDTITEEYLGPTFNWMQQMAKERNAAITGSVLTKVEGNYYNRLYWVEPNGSHKFYDKKHLFRLGKEWKIFTPGTKSLVVEWKGWKIKPLVCYDLRFPVWSKNRLIDGQYEYDLLIYVANWPAIRKYAWKHLLISRALENLSYVAGINRVGQDGHAINHSGDSMLVDTKGQIIAQANAYHEEMITTRLSFTELQNFRDQFPFSLDWDEFELK
jgi:predicted amidohydrolase